MCDPQFQRRCFSQAGVDRFCRETHSGDEGRNSKIHFAAGQECLRLHISNELQIRCKPSGPQLQDCLVGLGQQILFHTLFFHSVHPLSSTPPHPQLAKEELLGLAQQSLFPCRTGQLPQAIPGTSFTCWDTNLCQKGRVSVALHRDRVGPGSTAVLGRQ